MFEAKLEEASGFKKIVEAFREMIGECNLDCSESGIALQSLDKSHIVLVSLLLGPEMFLEYRCDHSVTLGVNVASLSTVLRCGSNDDQLTIRSEDQPNELDLTFEDHKHDRISEFNIRLMEIDQEYLSIPETEYSASITMPSGELQRILRDLKNLSESVVITANKDEVVFAAEGDVGKGAVHVRPFNDVENTQNSVSINIAEPVTLSFNLQYFTNITKASSLSDTVTLQLAEGTPAMVEYKLPYGHVRYYFAPKIGNDDDE